MSNSRDNRNESASTPRGLGRLKQDGAASLAEVREFMTEMRGKGAGEVLGALAQSNLLRAFLLSALACGVFLVVFTAVPYAFSDVEVTGYACKNKACNKVVEIDYFKFCPHCGTRKGENFPPSATVATDPDAEESGDGKTEEDSKTERMAKAAKAMKVDEVKKGSPKEIENLLNIDLDK